MAVQIQLRNDTASNWTSANPVLAAGELGIETNTGKMKVGNGSTAWNSLSYFQPAAQEIISQIVGTAPATLDTLGELADALNDDANYASTITTALAAKAPLASPTFTGTVVLPSTTSVGDVSSTELGYLNNVTSAIQTQLDAKAPIASPTFTGTVSGTVAAAVSAASAASAIGFRGIPASGAGASGAYTLVAADAGELVYTTTSRTVTIPANSSVPFEIGTTIVFISGAGATTTIAITSDTLLLVGPGTTGTRTLAAHGMATAVKVAATTWYISGNGLT